MLNSKAKFSVVKQVKQLVNNIRKFLNIIDDVAGKTLASASSLGINEKITKSEKAAKVGQMIAQKAQEAGIVTVVFDRNGFLFHGRVKQLADAARNAGLKF